MKSVSNNSVSYSTCCTLLFRCMLFCLLGYLIIFILNWLFYLQIVYRNYLRLGWWYLSPEGIFLCTCQVLINGQEHSEIIFIPVQKQHTVGLYPQGAAHWTFHPKLRFSASRPRTWGLQKRCSILHSLSHAFWNWQLLQGKGNPKCHSHLPGPLSSPESYLVSLHSCLKLWFF